MDGTDWRILVQRKRDALTGSIKRLSPPVPPLNEDVPLNVTSIPRKLLLEPQIRITEMPPEDLLQKLATRKLSSVEVTRAFLQRAGLASNLVNCVTELMPEAAIRRAEFLDDYLLKHGRTIGPLHGLPISAKEHMSLKGLDCNAGFVSWIGNISDSNALIAQLLFDAGCVFYVRTTVPQTLMHLETSSNIYGATVNPYNRKLTAGGSSGGEGALLGLYGSCLGSGSDIGGSIRTPAANVGVFGLKPTSGRLPLGGFKATKSGAEQVVPVVGPLSTSLDGIRLFMKAIIDKEPWQFERLYPAPWKTASLPPGLDAGRRPRVGIMIDDGVVRPHPPVLRAMAAFRTRLEESGDFDIVDFSPYKHDEAWRITSSLYFADGAKQDTNAINISGEPWLPLSEFIIKENPNVKELSVEELWKLTAERDDYRKQYLIHRNEEMSKPSKHVGYTTTRSDSGCPDFILCPAGPGLAPPLECSRYWGYTAQWNLLDWPCMVFPTGMHGEPSDKLDSDYKPRNRSDSYNQSLCKVSRVSRLLPMLTIR